MAQPPLIVPIPCPSGKHPESVVTFRNHNFAAMLCIPCEHAWTEPASHAVLQDLPVLDFPNVRRHGE